jgi:3-hydroxyisobutyrate dehydrogenase-like beta-hydroxyacid dehydrogenase
VRVGLLFPGEMGAAVGAAANAEVVWASEGRSRATAERAERAGLVDAGSVSELVASSEIVLSVCPPAIAEDVAAQVLGLGFAGIYVDANAVAPSRLRQIAALGSRVVDGAIIGGSEGPRLYLSGESEDVQHVAELFEGTAVAAVPLGHELGAASALKMAYGGWNKGQQALLLAIRALAAHEGVDDALVAEWKRSMPDVPARSERAVSGNIKKAWRFVGEMEENAATFAAAGLPTGFHEAAGEIYRRLAGWKDTATPPSMAEVAKTLAP